MRWEDGRTNLGSRASLVGERLAASVRHGCGVKGFGGVGR